MRSFARLALSLVTLATVAAPLAAQTRPAPTLVGTGMNVVGNVDRSWTVSWERLLGGPAASGSGQAMVVASPPGAWVPALPGSRWIAVETDASLPGGTGDNARRYRYEWKTTFDLTGWSASRLDFRFSVDNGLLGGYRLNDGALRTVNQAGAQIAGNTLYGTLFDAQDFTTGFRSGVNTLTVVTFGDGQTDGLLVRGGVVTATSTVPEPSTYALMGTGLLALGGVARRRARTQR